MGKVKPIDRCREKEANMPISELHARFTYSEEAGLLSRKTGVRPGYTDAYGYRIILIDRKHFREHRIIWAMVHGHWPTEFIDHENRQRDANRLSNLREANIFENAQNSGIQTNNKSGFTGVHYRSNRNRWVARVQVNGRRYTIGMHYHTAAEAAAARSRYMARMGLKEIV